MRFRIAVLCMFLVVNVKFGVAQDTQVKVRVFDDTTTEESTPTRNVHNDKNFFYTNPYLFGRGAFTVGYERALHENHSIQIDYGFTHRDYVYEFINDDEILFGEGNATVKMGRFLQVGYKFYPKGINDFDGGLYLSPVLIIRNYNISEEVEEYDGSNYVTTTVDRSYKMKEVALKFGYCSESFLFDDLIMDMYFGIGSREHTGMEPIDPNIIPTVTTEVTTKKPAVYFGAKLGFVF